MLVKRKEIHEEFLGKCFKKILILVRFFVISPALHAEVADLLAWLTALEDLREEVLKIGVGADAAEILLKLMRHFTQYSLIIPQLSGFVRYCFAVCMGKDELENIQPYCEDVLNPELGLISQHKPGTDTCIDELAHIAGCTFCQNGDQKLLHVNDTNTKPQKSCLGNHPCTHCWAHRKEIHADKMGERDWKELLTDHSVNNLLSNAPVVVDDLLHLFKNTFIAMFKPYVKLVAQNGQIEALEDMITTFRTNTI